MTTDYRAMCAELVEALHEHTCLYEGHVSELVTRARALLDQREPQPPAAGEVVEESWYSDFADWLEREMPEGTVIGDPLWWASKIANRIIAADLLQHQHPQPVAVSERPWEREGWCDEQGRCWWLKQRANPDHDLLLPTWHLQRQGPAGATFFRFTHCLPANALPTPEALP